MGFSILFRFKSEIRFCECSKAHSIQKEKSFDIKGPWANFYSAFLLIFYFHFYNIFFQKIWKGTPM